jgi:hypothetical protein
VRRDDLTDAIGHEEHYLRGLVRFLFLCFGGCGW